MLILKQMSGALCCHNNLQKKGNLQYKYFITNMKSMYKYRIEKPEIIHTKSRKLHGNYVEYEI